LGGIYDVYSIVCIDIYNRIISKCANPLTQNSFVG